MRVRRLPEENTKEEVSALAALALVLVELIPGEAITAVAVVVVEVKSTGALGILPMDVDEVDVFCACRRLTGAVVLSTGEVCRRIGMRGAFSSVQSTLKISWNLCEHTQCKCWLMGIDF